MHGDRPALGLPDLEPLLRDAVFPLLAQVIEKVSGAADEAGEGAEREKDAHIVAGTQVACPFALDHAKPTKRRPLVPHLLLVDDDPEQLEWLSELAKAEGFSVSQADSLRAARIHLSRLQPDLLLTDLQLPDGKGMDLVGDLEVRDSTEVVLITGHASVESAVEALRLGATDYLVKPVDMERLKAIPVSYTHLRAH